MAQYDVKHACGHVVTHRLFGKHEDRYSRIEWMKDKPCPDCRRVKEQEEARATAAALNLPPLIGTPKQIAWGEKVRAEAVKSDGNKLPTLPTEESIKDGAEKTGIAVDDALALVRRFSDSVLAAENKLRTETSAVWWIDNRDTVPWHVSEEHRRAYEEFMAGLALAKAKAGLS
jgi:hypothetical protein